MPKAEKKEKAPKKEKDKDAPKRALAAYMFFSKASVLQRALGGRFGVLARCALPRRRGTARARPDACCHHGARSRLQDMRPVVKEENPSISFGEIGKTLGAKWADADEKTKKVRAAAAAALAAAAGPCGRGDGTRAQPLFALG
jgi:hypothetical protein